MIDERTGNILAAAVREFIRTGEPVSSGHLYDRYEFGIKPAMIRLVLKDLDDEGYLEQPNYSAGRVPSDRGYEFYASHAMQNDDGAHEPARELAAQFARRNWDDVVHEISRELGVLSAAATLRDDETYKSGLEMLVDRLDFESRAELRAVIRDFEALDERIEAVKRKIVATNEVRVFVGKKSPVTKCPELSVVCGEYEANGERMVLFAIGPKRMDYERAARIFKNLTNKN